MQSLYLAPKLSHYSGSFDNVLFHFSFRFFFFFLSQIQVVSNTCFLKVSVKFMLFLEVTDS